MGSEPCDAVHSETANLVSCWKKLADQGQAIARYQRLVKSLRFEGHVSREQMITHAHDSTFTWIFDEKRLSFVDWAVRKNGMCKGK